MAKMSAKTFFTEGFLLDVNRLYFHPLGLHLGVEEKEDGTMVFSDHVQVSETHEGFYFEREDIPDNAWEQTAVISQRRKEIAVSRVSHYDWAIQPIKKTK